MRRFECSRAEDNLKEILGALPAFDLEAVARESGYRLRRRKLSLTRQVATWVAAIWGGADDSLATLAARQAVSASDPWTEQALSKADCQRPAALFEDLFAALVARASRPLRRRVRGLEVNVLDGSTIKGLAPSVARFFHLVSNGGEVVARAKVHVLYDPAKGPRRVKITDANTCDGQHTDFIWEAVGRNTLLIFDLGYWNFAFLDAIEDRGAFFVTRVAPRNRPVVLRWNGRTSTLRDYQARLDRHASHPKRHGVRVIEQRQPDGNWWRWCTNLTDVKRFPAESIIELYARRWEIEVFFRYLKHVFHLKRVRSRNENAVRVEIYLALIAFLLANWLMAETARRYPLEAKRRYCLVRVTRLLHALLDRRKWPLSDLYDVIATHCTVVLSKNRQELKRQQQRRIA
jgi:hypothetical protein